MQRQRTYLGGQNIWKIQRWSNEHATAPRFPELFRMRFDGKRQRQGIARQPKTDLISSWYLNVCNEPLAADIICSASWWRRWRPKSKKARRFVTLWLVAWALKWIQMVDFASLLWNALQLHEEEMNHANGREWQHRTTSTKVVKCDLWMWYLVIFYNLWEYERMIEICHLWSKQVLESTAPEGRVQVSRAQNSVSRCWKWRDRWRSMIWWEVERFTKILKELGRIRNSDVFSDTCSVSNFLWSLMKVGGGLQGRRGQADAVGRNAWKSGHVRGVEKQKLRKVKSNYIELTNGLIMNSNDILRIVKNEHVGRLPRFHRISQAFHGSQSWFEWRNDLKRLCGHQRVRNIPTMRHLPVTREREREREKERERERKMCFMAIFIFADSVQ